MSTEQSDSHVASRSQSRDGKAAQGQKSNGKIQSSQLMQLFEAELKDIYWAEKALVKAIPKMIKNATAKELKEALTDHLEETKSHVTRLEKIFSMIKVTAKAEKCDAMEGLIIEASDTMQSCEEGPMRDAGIISAAQKVEHYEIASYGTLRQFAETLDLDTVAELLDATLEEEKEADAKLSEIAVDAINVDAAEESV